MPEPKDGVNVYVCQLAACGAAIVTKNRDEGTTPFMITCKKCEKGAAYSSFYQVDQNLKPQYEWYCPGEEEKRALPEEMLEHVLLGGLLLRSVGGGARHAF